VATGSMGCSSGHPVCRHRAHDAGRSLAHFQQNRHLLHDLPALGAAAIQHWVKARYGVRVLVLVVPHTFGRRLNFNSHLHILVSAVGLHQSESGLMSPLRFNKKAPMPIWRYAVITYLRQALKAKVLKSVLTRAQLTAVFRDQYERWWNINIARFQSKEHFLRYVGRYVRRPPNRPAPFYPDHRSGCPILDEGLEAEASDDHAVFHDRVCGDADRACPGPLPACDSLFRVISATCKRTHAHRLFRPARPEAAPSSPTSQLAEFAAKTLWSRPSPGQPGSVHAVGRAA
jgi:hypothetical protein